MFRIDVRCRGCEATHTIRCDGSGIAPGVRMRCPECEESHRHDPVSELRDPDDPSVVDAALGETNDSLQAAQSAAYSSSDR